MICYNGVLLGKYSNRHCREGERINAWGCWSCTRALKKLTAKAFLHSCTTLVWSHIQLYIFAQMAQWFKYTIKGYLLEKHRSLFVIYSIIIHTHTNKMQGCSSSHQYSWYTLYLWFWRKGWHMWRLATWF